MTEDHQNTNRGPSKQTIACPPEEGQGLLWHNLNDFYCNFFDLIDVMAVMIDTTGTIRMFNRKAEKLTGYTREESIGQDCFSLLLPGNQCAEVRKLLIGSIKENNIPSPFSMSILTRGGAKVSVNWSISMVRDDDGEVFGLVGLGHQTGDFVPGRGIDNVSDNLYSHIEAMTHDLLNHSQVAMGYLELAMERAGGDTDIQCMLNRAFIALKKCGEIAVNVRKLSGNPDIDGCVRLTEMQKR